MSIAALIMVFVVAVVPLLPTEAALIGMGVLAASTGASLVGVIAVAAIGCSLSDHVLYLLGRMAGGRVLDRWAGKSSGAAMAWLTAGLSRWGSPVLVAGRWVPGGGTVGAVLVGMMRWRLPRFTITSVVGSALWSAYAALLGYFGGAVTGQPVIGLLLGLAVAAVVALTIRVVTRRTRPSAAPQLPTPGLTVAESMVAAGTRGPRTISHKAWVCTKCRSSSDPTASRTSATP